MTKNKHTEGPKLGKKTPNILSHKVPGNPLFQASRLEGKVRNFGIKNIGP